MTLIEAFSTDATEATPEAIAKYVRETYGLTDEDGGGPANPHRKRRKQVAERLRFYRDDYEKDVYSLVDLVFQHKQVREQRKRFAVLAMSQNVTRRIVDEISSVYDKPALRQYDDEGRTDRLRRVEDDLELHDLMAEAQRLTNLCNELLIWRDPTLRLITPDSFDVIPDPRDPLSPASYLIAWGEAPAFMVGEARLRFVAWRIYDERFWFGLNASGKLVRVEEHGQGRIPGVLCHRKRPVDELMDGESGKDILAAHKAVVLYRLMVLRLAKSQGENQPVLKGPLAKMASKQPMDGETPTALPPDVDLDVLRMQTDPQHYLKGIQSVISGVASTYGMSYEQLTMTETTDTTSGRAYKVRREKLTELRRQQAKRWKRIERELMDVLGLGSEGFSVNHAELAVPQDAKEEFDLFLAKARQGLDSHVSFLIRQDPDLTRERAAELIRRNIEDNAVIIAFLRALNVPRDADAEDPGRDPEDNGTDNDPDEDDRPPAEEMN